MDPAAETAPAPPRDRARLLQRLEQLRFDGVIGEDEENTLIRHYDELQRELQAEIARLEPEYKRCCRDEGKDAADRWLAGAARELGQRHGEATRRITDQLRAVAG